MLAAIREEMRRQGIDAYLITGADPHMNEYIAPYWEVRRWASGFSGSAGTVVITAKEAGLWTDSRYFIQAKAQLKEGFTLFKEGLPGTPDWKNWLVETLHPSATIGFDGRCVSYSIGKALEAVVSRGISFQDVDLAQKLWTTDRPEAVSMPISMHAEKYAGKSYKAKLSALREALKKQGADSILLSKPDDIAWLLNIRGEDIPFNPLALSFAWVGQNEMKLFIRLKQQSEELREALSDVQFFLYDEVEEHLASLPADSLILLDGDYCSWRHAHTITAKIAVQKSIVSSMKAIKNEVEIACVKQAMLRDGVAMVKLLKWLEEAVPQGNVTERTVVKKIHELRSEEALFVCDSFRSISAYGEHAALPHYASTPQSDIELKAEGIFLLDSGGQYLDGTTDITRTVALGEVTTTMKEDFTQVLKGHIALTTLQFPSGTWGMHIDAFARRPLWEEAKNYGHGTGHGVGFFLNVHEGPQRIAPILNTTPLEAGMICSNEPGMYREGEYGIRLENLIVCVERGKTPFGQFLGFENLTLCPIDRCLIEDSLLDNKEKKWLATYHAEVYKQLSPLLDTEHKKWLHKACGE